MEEKILGIDLGTNSIGISVRNPEIDGTVSEQLEYYCSDIFASGVGKGQSGEYSYAAKRTSFRSQRHLLRSRRYRMWRTLEVLIKYGYCPLSIVELDGWRRYDREKGLKRKYPIGSILFEQWIRLDFNGDGIPDYTSPFQLREELATIQLDFSIEENKYKLGRALYHIAQHRGFKSSKGETIESQDDTFDNDNTEPLKKSETEKSKGLVAYMDEHSCPTAGCAYAKLEREGIRIRANSEYQAVRSLYLDEISYIFNFQSQLDTNSDFFTLLTSRKKGEGSIFYKRPLRSQKGNVGKCTLEPAKSRCPISRPEFELFRAWSLLNNIKFKDHNDKWVQLPLEIRKEVYRSIFFLSRNSVTIGDIKKKIISLTNKLDIELNYPDKTKIRTCPVSRSLKKLLGDSEEWEHLECKNYSPTELWHVCYEAEDLEDVDNFAKIHLEADVDIIKKLEKLWGSISEGYAMLSLKAIKNINYFLLKGYIYSDSVLLAKIPDVFGSKWHDVEESLLHEFENLKSQNSHQRQVLKIVNNLIASYKSKALEESFAYKDYTYTLDENDKKDIRNFCIDSLSKAVWNDLSQIERKNIISEVEILYQNFFHSESRDYFKIPKLTDTIREFVCENFSYLLDHTANKKLKTLYHPSSINIYQPVRPQMISCNGRMLSKKLLGNPDVGVFKNPVAMRALYILRRHINELIIHGIVDEDYTRVVIEVARDMNDANMRKAIQMYQNQKKSENEEIAKILAEYFPTMNILKDDIYKARLMFEQPLVKGEQPKVEPAIITYSDAKFPKFITKYRLLKEQNFRCIYTGDNINIANLFSDDKFEFEHTIPRSICFDDSLANLTICEASYNRNIKKNKIPTQLVDDYEKIIKNIKPWIDKVEHLKERVEFWKNAAKFATTKEQKDDRIQQMHMWRMELDYWSRKVKYFTVQEEKLDIGFRNSQLVDTRIISKYAFHFLSSVFSHVEVQRGETTAVFRKVMGIQSQDEKKDRSLHSHHAIDATILTLIPNANRRDNVLKLFYDIEEAKEGFNNLDVEKLKEQLQQEKVRCGIRGINNLTSFIEENILINHIARNKALIPAKRVDRKRGKVVLYKNEDGEYVRRIKTGASIRGSIHGQSWYGIVVMPKLDTNGKPLRDELGNFIYEDNKPLYVKRYTFDEMVDGPKKKDWDDLEKIIVDKKLFVMMKSQHPGKSLKEAYQEGLFMLNKNGEKVNKIRHVRCFAPSNIHPVPIKKQTYLSNKAYKQDFIADVGDLYAMVRYENEKGKALYQTYSLYDISINRAHGLEDIPDKISRNGIIYKQHHVLYNDMKLLLYKESKEELIGLSSKALSKYLYTITGFESPSKIHLVHHLSAKPETELGKGTSVKNFNILPEKIRCGASTIKYLIENIDFRFTIKGIEFL